MDPLFKNITYCVFFSARKKIKIRYPEWKGSTITMASSSYSQYGCDADTFMNSKVFRWQSSRKCQQNKVLCPNCQKKFRVTSSESIIQHESGVSLELHGHSNLHYTTNNSSGLSKRKEYGKGTVVPLEGTGGVAIKNRHINNIEDNLDFCNICDDHVYLDKINDGYNSDSLTFRDSVNSQDSVSTHYLYCDGRITWNDNTSSVSEYDVYSQGYRTFHSTADGSLSSSSDSGIYEGDVTPELRSNNCDKDNYSRCSNISSYVKAVVNSDDLSTGEYHTSSNTCVDNYRCCQYLCNWSSDCVSTSTGVHDHNCMDSEVNKDPGTCVELQLAHLPSWRQKKRDFYTSKSGYTRIPNYVIEATSGTEGSTVEVNSAKDINEEDGYVRFYSLDTRFEAQCSTAEVSIFDPIKLFIEEYFSIEFPFPLETKGGVFNVSKELDITTFSPPGVVQNDVTICVMVTAVDGNFQNTANHWEVISDIVQLYHSQDVVFNEWLLIKFPVSEHIDGDDVELMSRVDHQWCISHMENNSDFRYHFDSEYCYLYVKKIGTYCIVRSTTVDS